MTSQSGSTNVPTAGSRPRCNRRRRLHRCRRPGEHHRQRQYGRAHRGAQTRKRPHRVRPPTTPKRQHVGRPPAAPRPLLPHHRHRRQLARQLAAHPHSAPDRRPIHRPIHRPLLRRHRRRGPFVWAAHQRHHHLLGQVGFPHGITVGSPPGVDLLGFRGRRGHPAPRQAVPGVSLRATASAPPVCPKPLYSAVRRAAEPRLRRRHPQGRQRSWSLPAPAPIALVCGHC